MGWRAMGGVRRGVAQKRKQLLSGDPRGKHFLWSSLLLGMGTTFAVIGPLNTYLRGANTPLPLHMRMHTSRMHVRA